MGETSSQQNFTQLLIEWSQGNRSVLDEMLPLVYDELRRLAAFHLSTERKNHTLQATALVHEAYMRMVNQRQVDWKNRAQFVGLASEMMRRIIVNHARNRAAGKRGGNAEKVSLTIVDRSFKQSHIDVIIVDDALNKLAKHDPRKSRVVELKFFGGLTNKEIAEILQLSHTTVEHEWMLARAWLHRALSGGKSALS